MTHFTKNVKDFTNGKLYLPTPLRQKLHLRETERGIKFIKDFFQNHLSEALNLQRVSAPILVEDHTGLNDHLSGIEKPVRFRIKSTGTDAEIVQSLAKWKRMALADYGFQAGEGLYTDMNAIRPDEPYLDNLHSVYVDQWDWERIMEPDQRTLVFLKKIVQNIYEVIKQLDAAVQTRYPQLKSEYLPEEIFFIHSEDLLAKYPDLSTREREDKICEEKGAVFIIGIGAKLRDGRPHDDRAADYDDWITATDQQHRGLNGDILLWYPPLHCAFEISSMGIRVNPTSLQEQLALKNEDYKREYYFHKRLLNGELPQTIGGGIGQSRLCMYFLKKAHIGEVQASIWSKEMIDLCRSHDIELL